MNNQKVITVAVRDKQTRDQLSRMNAEIMGTIDGKLTVKQSLALRATGNIKGEITTQTLMVEPNAIFNGTCVMGQSSVSQTKK